MIQLPKKWGYPLVQKWHVAPENCWKNNMSFLGAVLFSRGDMSVFGGVPSLKLTWSIHWDALPGRMPVGIVRYTLVSETLDLHNKLLEKMNKWRKFNIVICYGRIPKTKLTESKTNPKKNGTCHLWWKDEASPHPGRGLVKIIPAVHRYTWTWT